MMPPQAASVHAALLVMGLALPLTGCGEPDSEDLDTAAPAATDTSPTPTSGNPSGAPVTGEPANTAPDTPAMPTPSLPPAGSGTVPSDPTTPPPEIPTPGMTGMPTPDGASLLGTGTMGGMGQTSDRWFKTDVTRDGQNYFLMANGWGPNFESQSLTYNGTSFTITAMQGTQGDNYEPASYPTVFCGEYSDSQSQACGLPAAIDDLTSLRTGWRWAPNGNTGEYNAAYDVWLANGPDRRSFSGFLMVWLRDPPRQQPAGAFLDDQSDISVANVPGIWNMWVGMVNGVPIVNYTRPPGQDSLELEFDMLDFIKDARQRNIEVPGTHILSVAVGFEIWNGPVENLESADFYVDVQ